MSLILSRNIFLICSLLAARNLFGQFPCDVDSIMRYKGKWKKESDANMKPGPDQAQAITRIDKFQKILQAAYPDPKGIEAQWYRSMGRNSLIKDGPAKYQLEALFLIYRCDAKAKKMVPQDETGTVFSFFFNSFDWFLDEIPDLSIANSPLYLLRRSIGELNSEPLYQGIDVSTNAGTRYSRAVIIFRSGQQPYLPITRKEYLTAYINRCERDKAKEIAELKASFKRDTAAYNDFGRKLLTDKSEYFDDLIKPAQIFLSSMNAREAEETATVGDLFSKKYFADENKGGRKVVKLNPGYFNLKAPRYVPQFFVLHWTWNDLKPTNYCKDQLEKNLDFNLLKELLDK